MENANGRLRPFLPRKTDLSQLPPDYIPRVTQAHNHTPRKCLGYLTPVEILSKPLLHLKCESTFPPARERRGIACGGAGTTGFAEDWNAIVRVGRLRGDAEAGLDCYNI